MYKEINVYFSKPHTLQIDETALNCNMSLITVDKASASPWQCAVPSPRPGRAVAVTTTQHWFRVRLRLGSLKLAIEIHKYAMYKNYMYSHKCSLLGNTNINWGEMACFHCIIMPNAQLKLSAQKYEFVIRTRNSESMLSDTGYVHCEFMCYERLKDEVEQLLKFSFSMFNQPLHSLSTHMRVR